MISRLKGRKGIEANILNVVFVLQSRETLTPATLGPVVGSPWQWPLFGDSGPGRRAQQRAGDAQSHRLESDHCSPTTESPEGYT